MGAMSDFDSPATLAELHDYDMRLRASLMRGLAQSAASETVGLGDFSQYLELTPSQLNTIDFYKAYNVPATWFIGTPDPDGSVEVIALGEGFVWSIRIDPDGTYATSEATVGDFSTGIEV